MLLDLDLVRARSMGGLLGRQRAQLGKPPHGLRPGAAAELEQAALDVHLDRARADEQGLADLPAGVAPGDEQHDLQLAAGQATRRTRPAGAAASLGSVA